MVLPELMCPGCLNRKGQHAIRINDPWRVSFRWTTDGLHEVEIIDYH
ncbi:MAG: type II toxin-antitoxin system RelE/ParE family toxin [Luteolibacter sp.]